jgi:3-deoxy-D-manno-octulosonic-acid transferase
MYRLLYSFFFYLLIPLVLLRLLYRSLRAPAYRNRWKERFGFCRLPDNWRDEPMTIWVHSVSVGETLAAAPLVGALRKRYPEAQLVMTTMTPTGSERVVALFGDSVFHTYLPYDLPGAMKRFIAGIEPDLVVIMETELWPNLLHYSKVAGCRTMLVNARLSAKSARGYRRFSSLTRAMLEQLDVIAAQAEHDAERFEELGAAPGRVHVTGSLKFDISPPADPQTSPDVFLHIGRLERPVLIAASTREGEEEKILDAFQQALVNVPDLLLILVPRHPERFDSVARLCEQQGLSVERRSGDRLTDDRVQVWLGDSMGEMWSYYRLADLAFVGGSLVDTGCHNVLEPAALGIPVLVGPSQFNFAAICNQLQEAGALITVADQEDLAQQVMQLLGNPQWRKSMGQAGRYIVETNRGCLQRLETLIAEQLQQGRG